MNKSKKKRFGAANILLLLWYKWCKMNKKVKRRQIDNCHTNLSSSLCFLFPSSIWKIEFSFSCFSIVLQIFMIFFSSILMASESSFPSFSFFFSSFLFPFSLLILFSTNLTMAADVYGLTLWQFGTHSKANWCIVVLRSGLDVLDRGTTVRSAFQVIRL